MVYSIKYIHGAEHIATRSKIICIHTELYIYIACMYIVTIMIYIQHYRSVYIIYSWHVYLVKYLLYPYISVCMQYIFPMHAC